MSENIKKKEISEELKQSYLDYAMSVIVSRALPDARDGLKPVQRRILFGMKELGLWSNARFTKCANVVGTVLARYHPHGDVACYDALARMAQNFSLRYPLIWGQGNFGSIDNDPPAAYRYCLTKDTLVVTNRCLERIGKISSGEDISLNVLSFGGKINQASKWFDSGVHPIMKIKTFRGFSLSGTSNHPILTLAKHPLSKKPVFQWKTFSEIQKGDIAIVDRNNNALWHNYEPVLKRFSPEIPEKSRTKKYNLPQIMNPKLAFLLGFIIAEGYITKNIKKGYKKIGLCNTDQEIIKKIKNDFKKLFPQCAIYENIRKPLSYGKKDFTSLEFCSTYIANFFENLGVGVVKSKYKSVPHIIFDSTKRSTGAFLRGLFEGDGTIIGLKQNNTQLKLISMSKKLLEEVQILLLRFGIASFLREDKQKKYWFILICGRENFELFQKDIGFESKQKADLLSQAIERKNIPACSKTDFVPFLSEYLREKYKQTKIRWEYKEWLQKHNLDRYSRLKYYFLVLKKILEKEDLQLIKFFIEQKYLFDKIIYKKIIGKEKVYSIKVNSPCHSFVANGFINHNTEAKLTPISEEILVDIDKATVDFIPNYDNTKKEPVVLPSKMPNLLLNGSLGIAVGMTTNIPPHNLNEIVDALEMMIDDPKIKTKDFLKIIKGPDFPTGGIIFGKRSLSKCYEEGKGSIVVRGRADVEETKRGENIVITEIPWQVNKAELVKQIALLSLEKIIPEIKDVRDESNKGNIRIVIEIKNANKEIILEKLYRLTDLQKNYHFNLVALENGTQPKQFSLKELLLSWLTHRKIVVYRRTKFDLEKAQERVHILEGLEKALSSIDLVISIIKKSKNKEEARDGLIKKFKLSHKQAEAILELPLRTLTALERDRILKELEEKKKLSESLEKILSSQKKINDVIKKELTELKAKYGDKRRTEIIAEEIKEKAEIAEEKEIILFVNQKGLVKTFDLDMPIEKIMKDKENFGPIYFTNTKAKLWIVSKNGKIFQVVVNNFYNNTKYLESQILLDKDDKVIKTFIPKEDDKFLLILTKSGMGKKIAIESAISQKRSGTQIAKLKNDEIQDVISYSKNNFLIFTKKGIVLCLKDNIPIQTRAAQGVRLIKLKNDNAFSLGVFEKDFILITFANGYWKKISIQELKPQNRGGVGVKIFDDKGKIDNLIFANSISKAETIFAVNQKIFTISLSSIKLQKRIHQPQKLTESIQEVIII